MYLMILVCYGTVSATVTITTSANIITAIIIVIIIIQIYQKCAICYLSTRAGVGFAIDFA